MYVYRKKIYVLTEYIYSSNVLVSLSYLSYKIIVMIIMSKYSYIFRLLEVTFMNKKVRNT